MKNKFKTMLMSGAFALAGGAYAGAANAQDADSTDDESVQEQIIVTGSRGQPRSVTDSPVPIDVFSEEDLQAVPFTDANDILRTLVPSFNLSRQPISDGASFIRPAQLRGLPTDKTLVLVNSKRRHRA
ncbi:MAG: TonB-dependent receptor plug domain-containing protein, partial [Pseudomonadota bacterium]